MSGENTKTSKSIQKKIKIKHAKSITKDKSQPKITLFLHQMSQILRETTDIPVPAVFLSDDFKSSVKMSIDFHGITRPSYPSSYKIKLYAPLLFKSLRSKFNISEEQFLDCFNKRLVLSKRWNDLYKSHDKKFLVRYIESDDIYGFVALISHYYNHIVIYNNATFLPMYVGLCRIFYDGKYSYVVIMKNPIHTPGAEKVAKQTLSFSNKEADKDGFGTEIPNLNFQIPPEAHKTLIQRLSRDIEFLGSHSINKLTVHTKVRKYVKKVSPPHEGSVSDCESPDSGNSVEYFNCDPAYSNNDDLLFISIHDFSTDISSNKRNSTKLNSSTKDAAFDQPKTSKSTINMDKFLSFYNKKVFSDT